MASDWVEGDVTVAGGRLHTYRRGSGPPVVLAHGATDNGRCWTRVAARLEDRFELVAYDARFHGRSEDPVDGPHDAGRDLVDLVQALGLDRPALMGHSMGAGAVSGALALAPDAFRAAVLEDPGWTAPRPPRDTPPPSTEDREKRVAGLTGWVRGLQQLSLEQVIEQGRKTSPTWHEDEFPDWAQSKLQFRPPTEWGAAMGRSGSTWQEQVSSFRCPVLLACGTPGKAIVTPEIAAEAQSLSPLIEVAVFEAGHNIRREAFEPFVDAVRNFLSINLA